MKKTLQPSDLALFISEMADVQPLAHDCIEPHRILPPPYPRPPAAATTPPNAHVSEANVTTHDYLLYVQSGVQRRVIAELQRGQIPVALELDLHGLTAEYAYATLQAFLIDCRARRVRCVHIIHGKGVRSAAQQPVLKRKINYWLRLEPDVLAFCSATPRDGGTGAVYVLLRNPDKTRRAPH